MKLRNKKTGEIVEYISFKSGGSQIMFYAYDTAKHYYYNSLAEFNEEWEDYKEPKQSALRLMILSLTNFIENEPSDNVDLEDCKQMLEKLKAWERLKDTIIRIDRASFDDVGTATLFIRYEEEDHKKVKKDLDLLFGGEE